MDGHEYEYACAQYLKRNGFTKVQVTKASGDQGIDIIATKEKKYGIQCKYYSGAVGNKAVQEAYAGSKFYGYSIMIPPLMQNRISDLFLIQALRQTRQQSRHLRISQNLHQKFHIPPSGTATVFAV